MKRQLLTRAAIAAFAAVGAPVDFADGGKVADFARRPVVVEFEMSAADLYSFRFR